MIDIESVRVGDKVRVIVRKGEPTKYRGRCEDYGMEYIVDATDPQYPSVRTDAGWWAASEVELVKAPSAKVRMVFEEVPLGGLFYDPEKGDAWVRCQLTNGFNAVRLTLDNPTPDSVPVGHLSCWTGEVEVDDYGS